MRFASSDDQRDLLMLPPEHAQAAVEHAQTLEEAAKVMLGRTASYGLVWRQYGALSNLLNAARKIERLMEAWWHGNGEAPALHKDNLDDAIDAINYLAFFIQCARAGNLTGHPSQYGFHQTIADELRTIADTADRPGMMGQLRELADRLEQHG